MRRSPGRWSSLFRPLTHRNGTMQFVTCLPTVHTYCKQPLSSDTIPIGKCEAAQFNKLYPECSRSSVS